ncbi:tRNA (guanine(46)-N(7))-methyltransferase TrmB [Methylocella sp.]|uniref:tRNA (guanine(46)-N(7))-methyltransferase TrmB n=1 Tax=Methylocella sp. TaxID=1978226 RepID=UPI0037836663
MGVKDAEGARPPSGGLHGRRRGKALRARHAALMREALPALAVDASRPIDPVALFGGPFSALWLEIGFGAGEHLAARAAREPETGFIGCEAFHNGVAGALALIEAGALSNVRLYEGDARDVIEALPEDSLDGACLLFPDPWPKRRQRKRRFLSDETLARLARVMKPGAPLRFATDVDDNAGWTLARVLRSSFFEWPAHGPDDWRRPYAGWSGTRYEAKALREGRDCAYFTFVATGRKPARTGAARVASGA